MKGVFPHLRSEDSSEESEAIFVTFLHFLAHKAKSKSIRIPRDYKTCQVLSSFVKFQLASACFSIFHPTGAEAEDEDIGAINADDIWKCSAESAFVRHSGAIVVPCARMPSSLTKPVPKPVPKHVEPLVELRLCLANRRHGRSATCCYMSTHFRTVTTWGWLINRFAMVCQFVEHEWKIVRRKCL